MCDEALEDPLESLLIVELGESDMPAVGGPVPYRASESPRALSREVSVRILETAAALGAQGKDNVDFYASAVLKAAKLADWTHVIDLERAALSAHNPAEAPWWAGIDVEVAFDSAIVKAHDMTASACTAAERSACGLPGVALGYCVLAAMRESSTESGSMSGSVAVAGVIRVPSSKLSRGIKALPSPVVFADVCHLTDVLVLASDERFADPAIGASLVQRVAEATRRCAFEVHGSVPLVRCLYHVSDTR